MTVVVGTGSFAVISNEIDWLVHPELRASGEAQPLDWRALEAAVRRHAPDDVLGSLSTAGGSYFNYKASMFDANGNPYFLYMDRATGAVTGRTGTLTVQRFLRDLHRYLFMPSIIGLPLVTTMAVVLLISLYTGLKTVRNWRTVATRIRLDRGARVATGDFHKFAGLWGMWFFAIIIATSFWYFAELMGAVAGDRFEPERPGITKARAEALGETVQLADAATLAAAAEEAFPGFRATSVLFSVAPTQAATVLGRHRDLLVRDRANRVFLDPVDASIIRVQRSTEIGWVAYLNELADPLHFGTFGGLTSKLIWFLFGLGMLSLTLTGVWLSWRRLKSRSPTTAQLATLPVLAAAIIVGVPYVQRHVDDHLLQDPLALTAEAPGGIAVTLLLERDRSGAATGQLRLVAKTDAERLNLSEVVVAPRSAGESTELSEPMSARARVLGQTVLFNGSLPIEALEQASTFDVTLHFVPGTRRQLQIIRQDGLTAD